MGNEIGSKTPAQTCNDLFYLNNSNAGVDGDLRYIYSGNGTKTTLQISEDAFSVDFNKSSCKKALLDCYFIKPNDAGSIGSTYQISTSAGNMQKITLTANTTLSILSNLESSAAFEMTLLVAQSTGGHTLSFSGTFKTPSAAAITLSSTAGAVDILKLLSIDGGTTWYAYKQGSDLR
jgi:hypothetical protein